MIMFAVATAWAALSAVAPLPVQSAAGADGVRVVSQVASVRLASLTCSAATLPVAAIAVPTAPPPTRMPASIGDLVDNAQ